MAILINQFNERFRLATPLLSNPASPSGASGLKLARTCFAELPSILGASPSALGPEDPVLLILILMVLKYIRDEGASLRWLEIKLASHIAELSAHLPGSAPARHVWRMLRDLVVGGNLTDETSLGCSLVAIAACERYLGRLHAKTVELKVLGHLYFGSDFAAQEAIFLQLIEELDALTACYHGPEAAGGVGVSVPRYDERHLGVRMNLATFYNMSGRHASVVMLLTPLVSDPSLLDQCRPYRGIAFNLLQQLGNALHEMGLWAEAEARYRQAVGVAEEEMRDGTGFGMAELLDGLGTLEKCLRDCGKVEEADGVLREREEWVRRGLEGVGEGEGMVV